MAMCIIMPNGKGLSTKCTLIITHLIKAKLAAISTCLFAHNCQHSGKVGFRKQNQSHLSSISSASNRMLKEEEVWFFFERELPSLSETNWQTSHSQSLSTEYGDFCEDAKERERFSWHGGNNIDKHCLDEGDDAPTPFPGKWVGLSAA